MAQFTIKRPTSSEGEFFGRLMQMRDLAHLTHLAQPTTSGWAHKALDELYKDILDLADDIIESYQGIYGICQITIPSSTTSQDPQQLVQSMYDYIQSNRSVFKDTWVQNQIDEIAKLLAQTLYRLKFVK